MSGDDDAVARYVARMRELWGLADYGALAERLANPDGGPVRIDAGHLLVVARTL